ncbi:MAG: type II toxin-antitoxin system mRNA interferase toxin, RelE/StbE family [Sulfurimonas sp.]|nr:type II toxin-antitoxin system mRNA interferase toxin, RelE/StbE family [Sulfurimonas sp.]
MYRLISKKSVIKFIEKRVPKEKFIIEEKLKLLKLNPYPNNFLDIKKLSNSEYYRLRISHYRFIYEIIEDELVILMVKSDNRGDIY